MNENNKKGSFLSNLKLGVLFAIVMSVAMISITTLLYMFTYDKTKSALEQKLESKADSVLDFADVLLDSRNEKYFSRASHEVPQIIQNEVFAKFTAISNGEVYFNQSSKKPMNPKHLAKGVEMEILSKFEDNPKIKEDKRFIEEDGVEYLLSSRALYAEKRCTECHPTWIEGSVIAAEHVRINTSTFHEDLAENKLLLAGQWFLNIILIIGALLVLFKAIVSNRVNKLLEMMKKLSGGDFVLDQYVQSENIDKKATNNEIDKLFVQLSEVADTLKPKVREVVIQSKDVAFKASVASMTLGKLEKSSAISSEFKNEIVDLAKNSASLKHASDEFSVVFENRIARREVVAPVISGEVLFQDGLTLEEVFIFDKSTSGIAFYIQNLDEDLAKRMANKNGTIKLTSKLDGELTYNIQIVYCIKSKVDTISFCGCKISN